MGAGKFVGRTKGNRGGETDQLNAVGFGFQSLTGVVCHNKSGVLAEALFTRKRSETCAFGCFCSKADGKRFVRPLAHTGEDIGIFHPVEVA